jgi:hypothetical protein
MKYLYSSPNSARIALAQSAVGASGIEYELRDGGELPPTELWLFHDEDYQSARDVIKFITDEDSGS